MEGTLRNYGICAAAMAAAFTMGWLGYAEYRFLSEYFARRTEVRTISASPTGDCTGERPVEVATYTYTDTPAEPIIDAAIPDVDAFYVGEFYPSVDGVPAAFEDVEYISIETHEFTDDGSLDPWRPKSPIGMVRTSRDFKFTKIAVSRTFITFETERINGVNYRFIGGPNVPTGSYDPANIGEIQGRFTKLKNGKEVASFESVFYVAGC